MNNACRRLAVYLTCTNTSTRVQICQIHLVTIKHVSTCKVSFSFIDGASLTKGQTTLRSRFLHLRKSTFPWKLALSQLERKLTRMANTSQSGFPCRMSFQLVASRPKSNRKMFFSRSPPAYQAFPLPVTGVTCRTGLYLDLGGVLRHLPKARPIPSWRFEVQIQLWPLMLQHSSKFTTTLFQKGRRRIMSPKPKKVDVWLACYKMPKKRSLHRSTSTRIVAASRLTCEHGPFPARLTDFLFQLERKCVSIRSGLKQIGDTWRAS
jgi:hypothetical protein